MNEQRADPDRLLRQVAEEERRAKRGKLVIFFGAAPGVGKTYSMLEAARTERDLKRDVVAGIIETHGRYETGALVLGLELLPRRRVEHNGVTLEEFDLDGALAGSFSSTSSRIRTRRDRVTTSDGKTSKSSSTRESTSTRRSTCSTSRA